MAEETNNHNLNMYSQGETGWTHSPDMSHIEENLPIADTASNRTTYTPYNGALFFATDTGEVYEGDGSQWNQVEWDVAEVSKNGNPLATETWVDSNYNNYSFSENYSDLQGVPNTFPPEDHGSGAHDGTVATSTDISDLDSAKADLGGDVSFENVSTEGHPVVDVTAHGVEPGVWYSGHDGSTDHTAGIQSAIDAASNNYTQATVYFPPGEYYISSPLTLDSSVTIRGGGIRTSRIMATSSMHAIFQPVDIGTRYEHWYIGWLELECNGNADYGVELEHIHTWELEHLFMRDAVTAGVRLDRSWVGGGRYVNVGAGSTHAIEVGPVTHNVFFKNSRLGYTDGASVVAGPDSGGYNLSFTDCQFEGTVGFDLTDSRLRIFCNNCLFEREGTPIIQLDNAGMFVLKGGSYNGRVSAFADVTDTDFRLDDFHLRAATDNVAQIRYTNCDNDISVNYIDGTIKTDAKQIRHIARSRLIEHYYPPDEAILDTDTDGDGLADEWAANGGNPTMNSDGIMGDNCQHLSISGYDHIRKSFDAQPAGKYTIVVLYRYTGGSGGLQCRIGMNGDTSPYDYNSNGQQFYFPNAETGEWHLTNINLETEESGFDQVRFAGSGSSNTREVDVQAIQVFKGEHHVGSITPYDVRM